MNYNEYENNIDLKSMPVTLILIVANIIAGILCFVLVDGGKSDYVSVGGLNYEYIHQNKEYVRLLTYMFLHANFAHLANNMVALFVFGARFENRMGSLRTALIYIGSGIGAGYFSIEVSHMLKPDIIRYAAGASGAIFGLMCATFFVIFRGRKGQEFEGTIKAIILIVFYAVVSNGVNVDIWGHIGGAISGGILVFIVCFNKWYACEEGLLSRIVGVILILALCVFGISSAGIGSQASELQDDRITEVKCQTIYKGEMLTMGDCLDRLDNAKWKIFTSDKGTVIVEFTGNTDYKGAYTKIMMQFYYDNKEYNKWVINYVSIGGIGQDQEGLRELFNELSKFYFEKKQ